MDWTTLLLGLIKGTLAILADDYVYRARQARERARKHAPPQPKVDDWAEPTRPAAATAIVLETDEGRHFAASSFITVEGYATSRAQKERQPGESRRTRRKPPLGPKEVQLSAGQEATEPPCEAQLEVSATMAEDDVPRTEVAFEEAVVAVEAVASRVREEGEASVACGAPLVQASAHPESLSRLSAEVLNACRRFVLYKQRRRLVRYYASHHIESASGRRACSFGHPAGDREIQIGGSHGEG